MTIYGIIQPILYVLAGIAVKEGAKKLGRLIFQREDEDEDSKEKIIDEVIIQIIVNPINAIPILSDIIRTAMRKITGQKIWKILSIPMLDDIEIGARKLTKKEITAADYLKASAAVAEMGTAAPANTFLRYYEYITGKEVGEKRKKRRPLFKP